MSVLNPDKPDLLLRVSIPSLRIPRGTDRERRHSLLPGS
jgi:hypothetical protein